MSTACFISDISLLTVFFLAIGCNKILLQLRGIFLSGVFDLHVRLLHLCRIDVDDQFISGNLQIGRDKILLQLRDIFLSSLLDLLDGHLELRINLLHQGISLPTFSQRRYPVSPTPHNLHFPRHDKRAPRSPFRQRHIPLANPDGQIA